MRYLAIMNLLATLIGIAVPDPAEVRMETEASRHDARAAYTRLSEQQPIPAGLENMLRRAPLAFEQNRGQTDSEVRFLARGLGYSFFLTADEAVLAVGRRGADKAASLTQDVIRIRPTGQRKQNVLPIGGDPIAGNSHYYSGRGAGERIEAAHVGKVFYRNLYPNIDLVFHGSDQSEVEYDFIALPGADVNDIRLRITGAKDVEIRSDGALLFTTENGSFLQPKPVVYQIRNGARHEVLGAYRKTEQGEIGFTLGEYDPRAPLVIDPVLRLVYSTFLGGADVEYIEALAVDASGRVVVVGQTGSADFPRQQGKAASSANTRSQGDEDCFIAKLSRQGSVLEFSTFIGGKGMDSCSAVALDTAGNVYVTGQTLSDDFPTLNPYGTRRYSGRQSLEAVAIKLNSAGEIVYSTYLGVGGFARAVAVDRAGSAYFAGEAYWFDLDGVDGYQRQQASLQDAWVAKLSPDGSRMLFGTLLGGRGRDTGYAVAVDAQFGVYVAGRTASTDFPVKNALQPYLVGNDAATTDVFVTKLDPSGKSIEYSTYLGGAADDYPSGLKIDDAGNAYVAGLTQSTNFPVTMNAFQSSYGGGFSDAFVTKLSPSGNLLLYSSFFGGASLDLARAVAFGPQGQIYLAGDTMSSQEVVPKFPIEHPLEGQENLTAAYAGFVAKLDPAKAPDRQLLYSTYLGGNGNSFAFGLAPLETEKCVFVAGHTAATNYPTRAPYQAANAGGFYDGFVAKIAESGRIYLR